MQSFPIFKQSSKVPENDTLRRKVGNIADFQSQIFNFHIIPLNYKNYIFATSLDFLSDFIG